MAGCFGNHPEDRARELELNRYLDFIGNTTEGPERDVIDDVADDGDHAQGLVEFLIDDSHEFRKIVVQSVRMHRRCSHKHAPLDLTEIGRMFIAWTHPELDKYAEQEAERKTPDLFDRMGLPMLGDE